MKKQPFLLLLLLVCALTNVGVAQKKQKYLFENPPENIFYVNDEMSVSQLKPILAGLPVAKQQLKGVHTYNGLGGLFLGAGCVALLPAIVIGATDNEDNTAPMTDEDWDRGKVLLGSVLVGLPLIGLGRFCLNKAKAKKSSAVSCYNMAVKQQLDLERKQESVSMEIKASHNRVGLVMTF